MTSRMALYMQDKHPISYEIAMARYAEEKGFSRDLAGGHAAGARLCRADERAALEHQTPAHRLGRAADLDAQPRRHRRHLEHAVGDGRHRRWTKPRHAWPGRLVGADRLTRGRRPPDEPLLAMREHVEAIRRLFTMEEVSYAGQFVKLDRVRLDVAYGDQSPRDIPIYIGATGQHMLELTGEICDGVVLNYVVSVDYIRGAIATVAQGAAKAGKTIADVDRPELLVCALSDDDPDEAMMTGKSLVAYYLGPNPTS